MLKYTTSSLKQDLLISEVEFGERLSKAQKKMKEIFKKTRS